MNRRKFLSLAAAAALPAALSAQSSRFYGVEKRGDKWTIVAPGGRPVYLRGLNHFGDGTYMPLNLEKRYGSKEAWRRSLKQRSLDWGFNYLPPSIGPSESTDRVAPPIRTDTGGRRWQTPIHRTPEWPAADFADLDFPFTAFLEYPRQYMAGKGMPDVFSQDFRDAVDKRCREFCAPLKDNPNLIGYHFTHNPPWHSTNNSFDQWIADHTAPGSAGLERWTLLMRQIYGTADRWRRTYGYPIDSFDEIAEIEAPLRGYVSKANELRDKIAFMERICDEWYRVYSGAVRKYDPNHLILGDRNTIHLSPLADYAIHIMGRYVDVLSINVMGPADTFYEVMEQVTRHWDGPIHMADTGAGVIGDWAKAGYQTRDTAELDGLYESYMRAGLEHPQLVGFGWCGYYETPSSRSGIVDSRDDEPLAERVPLMKRWNQWMESEHSARF